MGHRAKERRYKARLRAKGQFKSPGRGGRGQHFGRQGQHFGRQPFHAGQQSYPYTPGSYPGTPGHPGSDSFLQTPGDESYDYQQLASDDSHDTQQSAGDLSQGQAGFHGAFGNGGGQQGLESQPEQHPGGEAGASPPDIKYEVTPMPFMKTNDFELIEIDPDEEDDI